MSLIIILFLVVMSNVVPEFKKMLFYIPLGFLSLFPVFFHEKISVYTGESFNISVGISALLLTSSCYFLIKMNSGEKKCTMNLPHLDFIMWSLFPVTLGPLYGLLTLFLQEKVKHKFIYFIYTVFLILSLISTNNFIYKDWCVFLISLILLLYVTVSKSKSLQFSIFAIIATKQSLAVTDFIILILSVFITSLFILNREDFLKFKKKALKFNFLSRIYRKLVINYARS